MPKETWKFSESQREDVCSGKLCPECLGTKIKETGCAPDGMNMNYHYECEDCGEGWEGY